MRSDIAQGDGMYKSADGGKTWSHIGLADSQQIGAHPRRIPRIPIVVYVAALGHPYGPNAERGVFRSKDGGEDWQKILEPQRQRHRRDRSRLRAGRIRTRSTPRSGRRAARRGASTRRRTARAAASSSRPTAATLDGAHGQRLRRQAGTHRHRRRAVASRSASTRSSTRRDGRHLPLRRRRRDLDARRAATRASGAAAGTSAASRVEPQERRRRLLDATSTLYRSDDGGKTFVPVKGAPGGDDYHALWIDPQHPERRILGVDQGARRLGQRRRDVELLVQPADRPVLPRHHRQPLPVLGLRRAAGLRRRRRARAAPTRSTASTSRSSARSRRAARATTSRPIRRTRRSSTAAASTSSTCARSRRSRSIRRSPIPDDRPPHLDAAARLLAARSARPLLRRTSALFRTEDGGKHWTVISPDLTREDPGIPPNLDPATAALTAGTGPRRGVIYAIAPSRLADHDLWAGTDDGLIWRTRDEGAHWDERHAARAHAAGRRSASSTPRTSTPRPRTPRSTAIASTTSGRTSTARTTAARTGSSIVERHPGRQLRQRRARGLRRARACSTPARRGACTSRSTTATTGSRCS